MGLFFRRSSSVSILVLTSALVVVPEEARALSGLYLQLGVGYGKYGGSELVLEEEANTVDKPVTGSGCCANGGVASQLHLGYSFFGIAPELGIVGNAWDLGKDTGAGGMVGGGLRIFPIDVLAMLGLDFTELPIDLGVGALLGYALVGKAFAYTGLGINFDAHIDFEITSFLSIGAKLDVGLPSFSDFVYTDYKNDVGRCLDDDAIQIQTGENDGRRAKSDQACSGRGPKTTYLAPQLLISFHFDPFE